MKVDLQQLLGRRKRQPMLDGEFDFVVIADGRRFHQW